MPIVTNTNFDTEIAKPNSDTVILMLFNKMIMLQDSFTGINGTTIDQRVPDLGPGYAGSAFEIQSNRCQRGSLSSGTRFRMLTFVGQSDFKITCVAMPTSGDEVGIYARREYDYQAPHSTSDRLEFAIDVGSTNNIEIRSVTAGVPTSLQLGSGTINNDQDYTLIITCDGDSLTFEVQGVTTISTTSTFNQTDVGIAFFASQPGSEFDSLLVESINEIRISNAPYLSSPAALLDLIKAGAFSYVFPEIDLEEAFPISGRMSVTIADKDDDVMQKIAISQLRDRAIDVKMGFQALAEADFIQIGRQEISRGLTISDDFTEIDLATTDVKETIVGDIFRVIPQSRCNGVIGGAPLKLTLDSIAEFPDPSNLPESFRDPFHTGIFLYITNGTGVWSYIQIVGSELRSPSPAFGTLGTISDNDQIRMFWSLGRMNIGQLILHYLLTTDDASGHEYYDLTIYDPNFKGFGFGIPASKVNIENIERVCMNAFRRYWFNCERVGTDQIEDGPRWLNDKILRPHNLKLFINGDSQIDILHIDQLEFFRNFTSIKELKQDDDGIFGEITSEDDFLSNSIKIKSSFTPFVSGVSGSAFTFNDDYLLQMKVSMNESVTKYGNRLENNELIELPTANPVTFHGGATLLDSLTAYAYAHSRYHFEMFGHKLATVLINTIKDNVKYLPGDIVTLTNPLIQDFDGGTLGWVQKKAIILGKTLNPIRTEEKWELKCLILDLYNSRDLFISQLTVAEGSITDKTVTFSATNDATVEGADGVHDFATSHTEPIIALDLEIVPQAGSGSYWMKLAFKAMFTATIEQDEVELIRFNKGSATFTLRLILLMEMDASGSADLLYDTPFFYNRLKLDFFERSEATSPTITMKEIELLSFNYLLSSQHISTLVPT